MTITHSEIKKIRYFVRQMAEIILHINTFQKFRKKDYNDSDSTDGDGSATSDEDLDEGFFRMFMVRSLSSSSDEE